MRTNKIMKALSTLKNKNKFSNSQLVFFILVFAAIGGYLLYRTFAAGPLVASLEAEQMVLPGGASIITDTTASAGKATQLLSNGTTTGSVNFPSSVTSLTINAKGSQCQGSPTMTVAVDGANLLTNTAVPSTAWAGYSANTNLSSGTHSLSISFGNDYTRTKGNPKNKCDRNLYIDVSNFFGPSVITPPPTVALSATPTSVTAGTASTLTWSSTNATSCTASGAWSGSQPTQGSTSTGALNQNSTYTLTCTGGGGSASALVSVSVASVPPPGGGPTIDGSWFTATSAWNTPIPTNPSIHPDSASMLTLWAPQGTNNYNNYWLGPRAGPRLSAAPAVAYPTASTPTLTIQINFPSCNSRTVSVPIPAGTDIGPVASTSENKLAVMLPNGDEWDFFDITPPSAATFDYTNEAGFAHCTQNNLWQALQAHLISPGWTGTGYDPNIWSDSNIPNSAGIIRPRDIKNTPVGGNWGHALLIGYSGNCPTGQAHPAFVYPAATSDGKSPVTACAPMGSRWQLDPSINCNTWPSIATKAEWLKQMCRTMQAYGVINGHTASCQGCGDGIWVEWYGNLGGYKYPWQDQATGDVSDWYSPNINLPSDLLSHFRVIDWTKWTGQ
jgi:hypothetical protein